MRGSADRNLTYPTYVRTQHPLPEHDICHLCIPRRLAHRPVPPRHKGLPQQPTDIRKQRHSRRLPLVRPFMRPCEPRVKCLRQRPGAPTFDGDAGDDLEFGLVGNGLGDGGLPDLALLLLVGILAVG